MSLLWVLRGSRLVPRRLFIFDEPMMSTGISCPFVRRATLPSRRSCVCVGWGGGGDEGVNRRDSDLSALPVRLVSLPQI